MVALLLTHIQDINLQFLFWTSQQTFTALKSTIETLDQGVEYVKINLWNVTSTAANIYLFKVKNKNTRKISEICFTLNMKMPGRSLVSLFSTLSVFQSFFSVSIAVFEKVNVCWVVIPAYFNHHNLSCVDTEKWKIWVTVSSFVENLRLDNAFVPF